MNSMVLNFLFRLPVGNCREYNMHATVGKPTSSYFFLLYFCPTQFVNYDTNDPMNWIENTPKAQALRLLLDTMLQFCYGHNYKGQVHDLQ